MTRLCVIVVNYRTPKLTIACLEALARERATIHDLRAIIVDGGSADGSADEIAHALSASDYTGWASLHSLPVNGGFAFANNHGLELLHRSGELPEFVALINPDARVCDGALVRMLKLHAREPRSGAVGALLIHEDGQPQSSAFQFPSLVGEFCRGARTGAIDRLFGYPGAPIVAKLACRVPWVTGAAVMLRTAALKDAGLFDDGFFLYFEETDLMRRLKESDWDIWHEPRARVIHAGGAATQIRDPERGVSRRKRLPAYWYRSRLRYFALAGGRIYCILAGLAWLAGQMIWVLRQNIAPRDDDSVVRPIRDFVRYGLWPGRAIARPAIAHFGRRQDSEPAWMRS